MIDNKIPCKTCICFALCKSKISLARIVVGCEILHEMWLVVPLDSEEKFLNSVRETFNKYTDE